MESNKGYKHLKSSVFLAALFLNFQDKDLVCRCHTLFSRDFTCSRNVSKRAPTQNIPVGSPVTLNERGTLSVLIIYLE